MLRVVRTSVVGEMSGPAQSQVRGGEVARQDGQRERGASVILCRRNPARVMNQSGLSSPQPISSLLQLIL